MKYFLSSEPLFTQTSLTQGIGYFGVKYFLSSEPLFTQTSLTQGIGYFGVKYFLSSEPLFTQTSLTQGIGYFGVKYFLSSEPLFTQTSLTQGIGYFGVFSKQRAFVYSNLWFNRCRRPKTINCTTMSKKCGVALAGEGSNDTSQILTQNCSAKSQSANTRNYVLNYN